VFLDNTNKSALVLNSIRLTGPGIGTVAWVVEVKVAPLRSGYHHFLEMAVPGGGYLTDPPVNLVGKGCHKQALFTVSGYRLTPGSQVRIYIVLRTLKPGKYSLPHQVVYYTQNGVQYKQAIPYRFYGSVADNIPYAGMNPLQAVCVRPTGARLLPGWHLPKNLKQLQQRLLK